MGAAVCMVLLCTQMASFCKDNTIKLEYHLMSNILNTKTIRLKSEGKKERASMLMKTLCFVSVRELGNV